MRNPFRRLLRPGGAKTGFLDLPLRSGSYTVEIPEVGAGHYLYDPRSDCPVHSERLEPWCDVDEEPVARDELHWHSRLLSEDGIGPQSIREAGEKVISGRQRRRVVALRHEREVHMARLAGSVDAEPDEIEAELAKIAGAQKREEKLRSRADDVRKELNEKREEHDALPRRERLRVTLQLTVAVSTSFFLFDVGIIGGAFELISGDLHWKIVLAIGVALAPLSTAIGIALWLSAADHEIRRDRAAGILALVAGIFAIVGLLLIVPFRAAAGGDNVIAPLAFSFLAFIQIGLGMAETMLYTVYFDSKVGLEIRSQIGELAARVADLEGRADREAAQREAARSRIAQIKKSAYEGSRELALEAERLPHIGEGEEGYAELLRGVVDEAILAGEMGRRRREQQAEEAAKAPRRQPRPRLAYTALGTALFATVLATVSYF